MDMLMGIQVCGVSSEETPKGVELPLHLILNFLFVIDRDDLILRNPLTVSISPFSQIEMQSNA